MRTDQDHRLERRRKQSRAIRRRRLTAVATIALAGLGIAAVATRGPDDRSASPTPTVPASQTPTPAAPKPVRTPQSTRGRLGSGNPVTLAFGGDIHFESPIRERLAASPASVLAPVAPILRAADIAVVNLETAVTDGGSPTAKLFTFRAPASAFAALEAGGVDVASLANNHGMDYGAQGLRDTLAAGKRSRVAVIGAGATEAKAYAPYRATIDGQRVAIIGATQVLDDELIDAWSARGTQAGLASAKRVSRLVRAVREARETSDTVVVFLHWGRELEACPTGDQKRLATALTRAGADVVVGSHAHVLLGAGKLGKALVGYGLGNFVFYASKEQTVRSGILEVTVTGRRVDDYRWRPARISGGIPRPLTGTARRDAIASWNGLRGCTGLVR